MAQFVSTCEGNSSKHASTFKLHDKLHSQGRVLQKWEKQKHVWATVQENIRRRIADGKTPHRVGMNMSHGVYEARVREEDVSLITNAAPSCVFTGFHTWQSTLRTNEIEGAVRYVTVGQRTFPYALYGKITDKRRRDIEHPINTRVVFYGQQFENVGSDSVSASYFGSDYYKERLQKLLPQIQQNSSHLLLPRTYLEVCGQPPPWTTNPDDAAAAKNFSVPPFVHIPPPPPKNIQRLQEQTQQEPEGHKMMARPVTSEEMETKAEEVDFATMGAAEETTTGVPILDISTTRVLFLAQPGELYHGSVKVKNTGTVTVYYSWAPLQPITALDSTMKAGREWGEVEENDDGSDTLVMEEDVNNDGQKEKEKAAEVRVGEEQQWMEVSDGDCSDAETDMRHKQQQQPRNQKEKVTRKRCEQNLPLRSLAKKSAQSKSFFLLSAQLDGVLLPDDEETFSFSVRAAFPGRFTQYYELLVIPPVSSRVIIELCAIVRDGGPSLEAISRPIADALEVRAIGDAQRRAINAVVANENIYEAVEIAKATQECIEAAKAVEETRMESVANWRKAWLSSTYLATRTPFNRAVYERLNALYQNLARTMSALGQPLHHEEWDGSMQTLQGCICRLRDAPSRNTLQEAFNVLLRAAHVSDQEAEPFALLLQRAAGMVAFSMLAQRTWELDDAIATAVGLSTPPILQTTPHVSHGNRSGGGTTANNSTHRKTIGGNNHTPHTTGGGKSHGSLSKTKGGYLSSDASPERGEHLEKAPNTLEVPFASDPQAEALAKEEYNAFLFTGMRRIVGDAVDCFCATLDSYRSIIEAACALPLLEVTASTRANDVRIIQNASEMEVDFALETAPPKKKR